MRKYYIGGIVSAIESDFTKVYKTSSNFPGTARYEQCMEIVCNAKDLEKIVLENDGGIPPVQTLLALFECHGFPVEEINDNESCHMGELMAFLFKSILRYQSQEDDVEIENHFGIKTAALYNEHELFEIIEG